MKEMLSSARRGLACLLDPYVALGMFGGGLLWTVANWLTGWLLLGPALVVLFRMSLEALRGRDVDPWAQAKAVVDDLPAALVAGILFVLPFRLWALAADVNDAIEDVVQVAAHLLVKSPGNVAYSPDLPSIPLAASAALFIHFAFHVFVFPLLAERHGGVVSSVRESWDMAERASATGALRGLARQLVFTSLVLVALLIAASFYYVHSTAGWLFTSVVGPLAVMVLAAWYLEVRGETEAPVATVPDAD